MCNVNSKNVHACSDHQPPQHSTLPHRRTRSESGRRFRETVRLPPGFATKLASRSRFKACEGRRKLTVERCLASLRRDGLK